MKLLATKQHRVAAYILLIAACVAVMSVLYYQHNFVSASATNPAQQIATASSVEIGIAELSPAGEAAGQAIPASACSCGYYCPTGSDKDGNCVGSPAQCNPCPGVAGACGTANGYTYAYDETWPGSRSLCSAGTAAYQSDPAPGSSDAYMCMGSGGAGDANCSTARALPSGMNLVVSGLTGNGTIQAGETVTFSADVENAGFETTPTFDDQFYYQWNSNSLAGWVNLGAAISQSALSPAEGARSDTSEAFSLSQYGVLYIRYCADVNTSVSETDETDNCTETSFNVRPVCTLSTNPAYPAIGQAYDIVVNVVGDNDGSMWLYGCPSAGSCLGGWPATGIAGTFTGGTGSFSQTGIPDTNPRYFQVHINWNQNPGPIDSNTCSLTVVADQTAPTNPTADLKIRINGGAWSDADQTIDAGDSIELQWTSTNAASCSVTDGSAYGFATGGATNSTDDTIITPDAGDSATFGIDCGGETDAITVDVNSNVPTVTIQACDHNGTSGCYSQRKLIVDGAEVAIKWTSQNADTCTFGGFDGDDGIDDSNELNGVDIDVVEPTAGNELQYSVRCSNSSGSTNRVVFVENTTGVSADPVILTVSQPVVRIGEDIDFGWNIGGNDPATCTIIGPNVNITSLPTSVGTYGDLPPVTINSQSTFTLNCAGETDTQTVYILPDISET